MHLFRQFLKYYFQLVVIDIKNKLLFGVDRILGKLYCRKSRF